MNMIHTELSRHHLPLLGWCAFALIISLSIPASAIEKIEAHPHATKLINQFMKTLVIKDAARRDRAVTKLLHKSMLTSAGELTSSVKRYSYKKACDNVRLYQSPVKVTQVHKGREVTIGFKETAERGRIDKYFVAKRSGVAGSPAPLHVFWPKSGGEPRLTNIGSL